MRNGNDNTNILVGPCSTGDAVLYDNIKESVIYMSYLFLICFKTMARHSITGNFKENFRDEAMHFA